jgi:uncharacterized membrane protein YhaH (DUF805 family)
MGNIGFTEILLLLIVLALLAPWIWAHCRIARKAGFSAAWGWTSVVPFVNFVMIFVFAFVDWPVIPKKAS